MGTLGGQVAGKQCHENVCDVEVGQSALQAEELANLFWGKAGET